MADEKKLRPSKVGTGATDASSVRIEDLSEAVLRAVSRAMDARQSAQARAEWPWQIIIGLILQSDKQSGGVKRPK
jgi:hypothetical protein